MLQALGGGLISKDMAMRELPFTVNVTQELEKIETEKMRDSLLNSVSALTQAIPTMAAQGQDVSDIVLKIAEVIKARQKGQALEDAIGAAFTPKQQVPPAGAPAQTVEQSSPAPEGMPVGGAPSPEGAGPTEHQMAPQGRPDIQSILSSLTSAGNANASVRTISRQ
jgi:hypothetical protein